MNDTLAKALYSKMFDYLVARINASIRKEDHQGVQLGVLDIYGKLSNVISTVIRIVVLTISNMNML